jgi:hypothetical protein
MDQTPESKRGAAASWLPGAAATSSYPYRSRSVEADMQQQLLAPESRLIRRVELHLLLAQLTQRQAASVRARGWFVLPWPEQHLTLCVHTTRLPTVDAYQMPPKFRSAVALPAALCSSEEPLAWSELTLGMSLEPDVRDVYLCSFDVRTARLGLEGKMEFRTTARTGTAWARLVMEAKRRGALTPLLAASETIQVAQLIGTALPR